MSVLLKTPENFIQNKALIKELNELFSSNQNVILFGEKGSGTTTNSIHYSLVNKIFDQVFFIESESNDKIELELNSTVRNITAAKHITLLEEIENSVKSSKVLLILDQVENFKDVEKILKKFDNQLNFLVTTHHHLGQRQNFVILEQPLFNFSIATNQLLDATNIAFQPKQIQNLLNVLMRKQGFISPYVISKIASIINFNLVNYTIEDILTKIYANLKSPIDILLNIIFDQSIFDVFATMLFFDHRFISLNLIESFFDFKRNRLNSIRTSVKKLEKMSLLSIKNKNDQNGIEIHDLVKESALKYINKDHQYLKNFGNIYEAVLNFYFDNFGNQLQDGILIYSHVKKILSFEFNFFNSTFSDHKTKRVNRLKSKLFYKLALFRISHLIDYQECLRLCSMGKIESEFENEFEDLIVRCRKENFNLDIDERLVSKTDSFESKPDFNDHFKSSGVLPVFMNSDDVFKWFQSERICQAIIYYFAPINGSQLMDYFVLLMNNKLFFEFVLKQEIPNATEDEISFFEKCLKKLFIFPLEKS